MATVPISTLVFLGFVAAGVVFLLYALVQFWREAGRRR